jgi:hypothetical protein
MKLPVIYVRSFGSIEAIAQDYFPEIQGGSLVGFDISPGLLPRYVGNGAGFIYPLRDVEY